MAVFPENLPSQGVIYICKRQRWENSMDHVRVQVEDHLLESSPLVESTGSSDTVHFIPSVFYIILLHVYIRHLASNYRSYLLMVLFYVEH